MQSSYCSICSFTVISSFSKIFIFLEYLAKMIIFTWLVLITFSSFVVVLQSVFVSHFLHFLFVFWSLLSIFSFFLNVVGCVLLLLFFFSCEQSFFSLLFLWLSLFLLFLVDVLLLLLKGLKGCWLCTSDPPDSLKITIMQYHYLAK